MHYDKNRKERRFLADPHQGNIMVSNGRPYWIDLGMVGHISDKDINIIQTLIISQCLE